MLFYYKIIGVGVSAMYGRGLRETEDAATSDH